MTSTLTMDFAGQLGVNPRIGRLVTDENFATLTSPGYIEQVARNNSVNLLATDAFVVSYDGGASQNLFKLSFSGITPSLVLLNPSIDNFEYENIKFVAKGGNDTNTGLIWNQPKLTIQNAIDSYPVDTNIHFVWVTDASLYDENLIIPHGIFIFAPNAQLNPSIGVPITIPNTGGMTLNYFVFLTVFSNGVAAVIDIPGQNSALILDSFLVIGDNLNIQGQLALTATFLATNTINLGANGHFIPAVKDSFGNAIPPTTGVVEGQIKNTRYGDFYITGDLTGAAQQILVAGVGRPVTVDDARRVIVYDDPANDFFTLPTTAVAPIRIGTEIDFYQKGDGKMVFAAGVGATISSNLGALVRTNGSAAFPADATAKKMSDTEWYVSGIIEIQP